MTKGPTSATSMWTSEPRQTQSVARVDFDLRAVHNGHERSEFGRTQASRRPNQR